MGSYSSSGEEDLSIGVIARGLKGHYYCNKIQKKISGQRQEKKNKLKAQFKHHQKERRILLSDEERNTTSHVDPQAASVQQNTSSVLLGLEMGVCCRLLWDRRSSNIFKWSFGGWDTKNLDQEGLNKRKLTFFLGSWTEEKLWCKSALT